MKEMIKRLVMEEEGQAMTEYGLIIALIAVVVIVALGILGGNIRDMFNKVADEVVITE